MKRPYHRSERTCADGALSFKMMGLMTGLFAVLAVTLPAADPYAKPWRAKTKPRLISAMAINISGTMRISFFFVAFVFLLPQESKGDSFKLLKEIDLQKILTEACNQVNDFYKARNFPIPAPSPMFCRFRFTTDLDYQQGIGEFIETKQSDVSARILTETGKIIKFHNGAAFHAAYGINAPLYDTPQPAKWTKQYAIEVATQFADIFIKPWDAYLGPPNAFFAWPFGDVDKTKTYKTTQGEWIVKWVRTTKEGQLYNSDGAEVDLSEQYGPHSATIFFLADYDEENITPIAVDKAVIEARKNLDKILGWGPAKGWLPGARIVGKPESDLLVVQPNNLLAQKSLTDLAFSGQRKARLAWVVTYHVSNPTNPNINGDVSVYIDAKDGSFLGGML